MMKATYSTFEMVRTQFHSQHMNVQVVNAALILVDLITYLNIMTLLSFILFLFSFSSSVKQVQAFIIIVSLYRRGGASLATSTAVSKLDLFAPPNSNLILCLRIQYGVYSCSIYEFLRSISSHAWENTRYSSQFEHFYNYCYYSIHLNMCDMVECCFQDWKNHCFSVHFNLSDSPTQNVKKSQNCSFQVKKKNAFTQMINNKILSSYISTHIVLNLPLHNKDPQYLLVNWTSSKIALARKHALNYKSRHLTFTSHH